MIKGFLFKNKPHMNEFSEVDILSRLDPLKESEDKFDFTTTIGDEEVSATRRSFYSEDLYISTYTSESSGVLDSLWDVYNAINMGAPEVLRAFKKGNAIFVAWPRFEDDKFDDSAYTIFIEELIRVSALFIREFGSAEIASKYIQSYVDLCVAWKK